mgnify:CR=1 FL=1
MVGVEGIDHICVAVKDLDEAVKIWGPFFGKEEPDRTYTHEPEAIKVAAYRLGEIYYELVASTREGSDVDRFLKKYGEGVMLISFKVRDIESAMGALKDQGYQLIGESPRTWRSSKYAFVHPRNMNGVLVEIIAAA